MDKLYTIIEVATKLNVSDKTLRRWEEAGRFKPSRTLGNQRRYSIEDLQILDAIKHGTINEQKDLLTIEQAGRLCGVSSTTLLRWENDGKIHPFITSGNTYYIRQKLMEKMDELKKAYPPEEIIPPKRSTPLIVEDDVEIESTPKLTVLPPTTPATKINDYQSLTSNNPSPINIQSSLINMFITIILILTYHFAFASTPSKPVSPQSGSVQGASSITDPTLDLLKTILDSTGALTTTTLTSKISLISPTLSLSPSSAPISPTPGMVYYDAASQSLKVYKGSSWSELSPSNTYKVGEANLIAGSTTLPKGRDQVSVTQEKITSATPVTITFTTDYAPAKKYWVTTDQGSFTLHTDFPVSQDSTFNYSLYTPTSSASAIIKP